MDDLTLEDGLDVLNLQDGTAGTGGECLELRLSSWVGEWMTEWLGCVSKRVGD